MFQTPGLALSPPLLAILVLLITPPAQTTEPATLTGIVRDQNTGEGLPYATLLITQDAHKQSLATDLHGRFQLSNLKPGTCHLKAIFVGYRSQTQAYTLQAGQKYPVELDLETDPILLKAETDPQTVSARNLMRRLVQQDRVGFLHMQYKDIRDYAFSAHAIQEVQRRYRGKNLGNLEYYIQGYYQQPEQYKQQIVGFRKSGT